MKLTFEQEEIISCAKSTDNIMINALAGTGKTTTIALFAKEITTPGKKIALSFGKKSVEDLKLKMPSDWEVRTFNSIGYDAIKNSMKFKRVDVKKFKNLITGRLPTEEYFELMELVNLAKNIGLIPREKKNFKGLVEDTDEIWKELWETLDTENEDLIPKAREILLKDVDISLKKYSKDKYEGVISLEDQIYLPIFGVSFENYSEVIIDEAQDTNILQHYMISKIARFARLTVVGDNNQAIYAWRGASATAMEDIKKLKENWKELSLTESFRVPKIIAEKVKTFVPTFKAYSENRDGNIVNSLNFKWNVTNKNTTILCRNNSPLVDLALKLYFNNIPFTFLGKETAERILMSFVKRIFKEETLSELQAIRKLMDWETEYLAKIKDPLKIDRIKDRTRCITALLRKGTTEDLRKRIKKIFSQTGEITLSTIHKYKGLEREYIIFLDPWRIPSNSIPATRLDLLQQEYNLRYVAWTRAYKEISLANVDNYEGGKSVK